MRLLPSGCRPREAINASPGLVALYGPILDVHSTGELAMTKMTVLYAVLVAVMVLFVVRRHTRLDEEGGQAELIGGAAMGPVAPLWVAMIVGAGVAVALGLLAAAANIAGGLPMLGSLAFGASWAGTGLVGAGLTAVSCQLSPSARTCAAIASGAIGALFVVRAVGDTTDASWLSWLSPFGWNTQLRSYGDTRWWVLLLYVASACGLAMVAVALRHSRDLGAGIVGPRAGPATGSPRLAGALSLSVRLHAPMLVGWTVTVGVMGVVFGAISPSFDEFDSAGVRDVLERIGGAGVLRDTLLGAVLSVISLVVTCFAVAVVIHGAGDEQQGRTEQVLATAASRAQQFVSTAIVALIGATWLLLVAGVALAVGVGGVSGAGDSSVRLVASALAQAPAMWVVAALAVLCFALRSRWALVGWGFVVVFATLGQVGELVGLPRWVLDLSPYSHAPKMPVAPFELGEALALSAIAAAVLAGSWLRYRTRDIG